MARAEEPQRALKTFADVAKTALVVGIAVFVIGLLSYLTVTVPQPWFPSVAPIASGVRDFRVVEGNATVANDELVLSAVDPRSNIAIVSVNTSFRAREYPAIAWDATGVPDDAVVRMIWRTDYAPAKMNSVALRVASGRLVPIVIADDSNWIGRITGIALTIRGPLSQPVQIRGVTAKPLGLFGALADRWSEWVSFEKWSGATINTLTGSADIQAIPLPPLFALVIAVAAAIWFGWNVRKRTTAGLPIVLAALFVACWTLLDVRWTWNLTRQVRETAVRYAGKDWRERRLAAEDGPLFAFIEQVRGRLPSTPARVFMLADADYFRGRGAYHLYPHNVFFDPWANTLPPQNALHSGDYVVVYQRRGVQYDPSQKRLRWDDGAPLAAELVLADRGAALFRIL